MRKFASGVAAPGGRAKANVHFSSAIELGNYNVSAEFADRGAAAKVNRGEFTVRWPQLVESRLLGGRTIPLRVRFIPFTTKPRDEQVEFVGGKEVGCQVFGV
jgi:hypothetical protein